MRAVLVLTGIGALLAGALGVGFSRPASMGGQAGSGTIGAAEPGPNLPAGLTTLARGDYDDLQAMASGGWAIGLGKRGMLRNGLEYENPEIVPSPDSRFPSELVMRHTWPEGLGGAFGRGTSGGTRGGWEHAQVTELYVSLWVRYDTRYRNSSGNHKMFGVGTTDGGQWLWVRASGDAPTLRLDANSKTLYGPNGPSPLSRIDRSNRPGSAGIQLGQVHLVEVYVKMDSAPGACDGTLRMWLNGAMTHEYGNECWRGDGSRAGVFTGFVLDPIVGGRDPAPEAHMWIDNVYIAGA